MYLHQIVGCNFLKSFVGFSKMCYLLKISEFLFWFWVIPANCQNPVFFIKRNYITLRKLSTCNILCFKMHFLLQLQLQVTNLCKWKSFPNKILITNLGSIYSPVLVDIIGVCLMKVPTIILPLVKR